jgi:two-component system, OmpR family, response regulator ResD
VSKVDDEAEQPMTSVLIAESEHATREAMARSLTRKGCRVTAVANGVDGLEAVRRQSFDVIVTDLSLPERGALWLWREALVLRRELRGRFLFLSSEPRPRYLGDLIEAEGFLLRPVSMDTLWSEVQRIIRRAKDRGSESGNR